MKGKIIPNGVLLEKHEYTTVLFFTKLGFDVELIPQSNIKGVHTPDIIIDGIKWEIKSPQGKSKASLEHAFRKARKQSENITIDLRRSKIVEEVAIKEICRRFNQTVSCKKLRIITKNCMLLEYQK